MNKDQIKLKFGIKQNIFIHLISPDNDLTAIKVPYLRKQVQNLSIKT